MGLFQQRWQFEQAPALKRVVEAIRGRVTGNLDVEYYTVETLVDVNSASTIRHYGIPPLRAQHSAHTHHTVCITVDGGDAELERLEAGTAVIARLDNAPETLASAIEQVLVELGGARELPP
jgi:hypothetical protein